jgi:hypothetical protein
MPKCQTASGHCVIIAFVGEDLTLTPAQEFRETRDWLAQHKRDPFLWLIILMPLTLAAINFGGSIALASAFPRTDAKRAIEPVSPSVGIVEIRIFFCKLPHRTYIFGYDLAAPDEQGRVKVVGRTCRDIFNRQWVWAFHDSKKVNSW